MTVHTYNATLEGKKDGLKDSIKKPMPFENFIARVIAKYKEAATT